MEINKEFLKTRPLSYSSLTTFGQSPQHYIHYLTAQRERTPALVFGGIVDVLVLTPERFEDRYAVQPELDRRTKDGKAKYEEFCEANKGKEWITVKMHEEAQLIASAVRNNPISKSLLDKVKRNQVKLNWDCKESDLPFVGYVDGEGDGFIFDLKTTTNADPEEFIKSAYNFQYHIQAAAYLEAYKTKFFKFPDYYFIVVEKTAPYGVSVLRASNNFLDLGKQELSDLKIRFNFCMTNNLWHQSYEFKTAILDGTHSCELPGYALSKLRK